MSATKNSFLSQASFRQTDRQSAFRQTNNSVSLPKIGGARANDARSLTDKKGSKRRNISQALLNTTLNDQSFPKVSGTILINNRSPLEFENLKENAQLLQARHDQQQIKMKDRVGQFMSMKSQRSGDTGSFSAERPSIGGDSNGSGQKRKTQRLTF